MGAIANFLIHVGKKTDFLQATVQPWTVAYIRLPFYEAKVLFSEGPGRM